MEYMPILLKDPFTAAKLGFSLIITVLSEIFWIAVLIRRKDLSDIADRSLGLAFAALLITSALQTDAFLSLIFIFLSDMGLSFRWKLLFYIVLLFANSIFIIYMLCTHCHIKGERTSASINRPALAASLLIIFLQTAWQLNHRFGSTGTPVSSRTVFLILASCLESLIVAISENTEFIKLFPLLASGPRIAGLRPSGLTFLYSGVIFCLLHFVFSPFTVTQLIVAAGIFIVSAIPYIYNNDIVTGILIHLFWNVFAFIWVSLPELMSD